jgi:hypothetical protein
MIFKKGDRVICIDVVDAPFGLCLNKQYIILYTHVTGPNIDTVTLEENPLVTYYSNRFILNKQYYRKEKLKQLRNGN